MTNAFHFSEDLVTTFISLALLQRRSEAGSKPANADTAASAASESDPAGGAAAPAHPAAGSPAAAGQQSPHADDWTAAQLAIVGDAQAGPFLECWQRLFPAHPIRFLAEVASVALCCLPVLKHALRSSPTAGHKMALSFGLGMAAAVLALPYNCWSKVLQRHCLWGKTPSTLSRFQNWP